MTTAVEPVRIIDTSDATAWDAFLEGREGATFSHLAGWDGPMAELGHRVLRTVAMDGSGNWLAVLPLVHVRSRIFGNYLVSMPFLNDGGPVGEAAGREALVEKAIERAAALRVDLLELRTREAVAGLDTRTRKVTVLLDLPDSRDELWEDVFRSKLRSQIRRPMKEGMEARFGPDQLDAFYGVFARNMRDLGTPVLPRAFFEATVQGLGEGTLVGAVYHEGRPVATGFGLRYGEELEMTWASSLREYDRLAPNMLLYWSFMEACIERGVGRFNFGRCTPGGGTHRFKRQWGGTDVPLPWGQWSPRGVSATPNPEGGFGLAVKVWQRLPLALTNRLGPRISRGIP